MATTDVPSTVAQPGPWDAPWHRKEDSAGWETVYRGAGRRRHVKNTLVLELSPEQWAWLGRRARASHLTPHAVLKELIDTVRIAEEATVPVAPSEESAT
jgi:hypothetical protein